MTTRHCAKLRDKPASDDIARSRFTLFRREDSERCESSIFYHVAATTKEHNINRIVIQSLMVPVMPLASGAAAGLARRRDFENSIGATPPGMYTSECALPLGIAFSALGARSAAGSLTGDSGPTIRAGLTCSQLITNTPFTLTISRGVRHCAMVTQQVTQ